LQDLFSRRTWDSQTSLETKFVDSIDKEVLKAQEFVYTHRNLTNCKNAYFSYTRLQGLLEFESFQDAKQYFVQTFPHIGIEQTGEMDLSLRYYSYYSPYAMVVGGKKDSCGLVTPTTNLNNVVYSTNAHNITLLLGDVISTVSNLQIQKVSSEITIHGEVQTQVNENDK
jgi:hypothetical protein